MPVKIPHYFNIVGFLSGTASTSNHWKEGSLTCTKQGKPFS